MKLDWQRRRPEDDHPVFLKIDLFIDWEIWIIVNLLATVSTNWTLITQTDKWKYVQEYWLFCTISELRFYGGLLLESWFDEPLKSVENWFPNENDNLEMPARTAVIVISKDKYSLRCRNPPSPFLVVCGAFLVLSVANFGSQQNSIFRAHLKIY